MNIPVGVPALNGPVVRRKRADRHHLSLQILVADQLDVKADNFLFHARTDQGVELMLELVERGMRIKFRIAGRQFRQQLQNIFLVHLRIL